MTIKKKLHRLDATGLSMSELSVVPTTVGTKNNTTKIKVESTVTAKSRILLLGTPMQLFSAVSMYNSSLTITGKVNSISVKYSNTSILMKRSGGVARCHAAVTSAILKMYGSARSNASRYLNVVRDEFLSIQGPKSACTSRSKRSALASEVDECEFEDSLELRRPPSSNIGVPSGNHDCIVFSTSLRSQGMRTPVPGMMWPWLQQKQPALASEKPFTCWGKRCKSSAKCLSMCMPGSTTTGTPRTMMNR
mmetsp:Transcript_41698/g.116196  ORF Transcript_41698/g.116196 Transcript_41698/m.116196 type:complete len:249 (-) Transcript_41698:861-1607(-)